MDNPYHENVAHALSDLKTVRANTPLGPYLSVIETVMSILESFGEPVTDISQSVRSLEKTLLQFANEDVRREAEENDIIKDMRTRLDKERETNAFLSSQNEYLKKLMGKLPKPNDEPSKELPPQREAVDPPPADGLPIEKTNDAAQSMPARTVSGTKTPQARGSPRLQLELQTTAPCPANELATIEGRPNKYDSKNQQQAPKAVPTPEQALNEATKGTNISTSIGHTSTSVTEQFPNTAVEIATLQPQISSRHASVETYLLPLLSVLVGCCAYFCLTAKQERDIWLNANGLTRKHMLTGLAGHHWSMNGCPSDAQYM